MMKIKIGKLGLVIFHRKDKIFVIFKFWRNSIIYGGLEFCFELSWQDGLTDEELEDYDENSGWMM